LVEAVPAESEVISRSIANIHKHFKITTWLNAVIALILYFLNLEQKRKRPIRNVATGASQL
ncbi:hypothetical protein, partial [Virgibacillus sp. M23]|uniref:hypothetical protein n=1 Tax=Virgibacillus sp. M23 TaxID=3079030 RepID=UPI002A9154DB